MALFEWTAMTWCRVPPRFVSVHFWLVPPVQLHWWMLAPSAVLGPETSTHLLLCTGLISYVPDSASCTCPTSPSPSSPSSAGAMQPIWLTAANSATSELPNSESEVEFLSMICDRLAMPSLHGSFHAGRASF